MKTVAATFQTFCLCLLLTMGAGTLHAEVPFSNGDRVLFLGDSITQDGRYVALVEAYLWATYPHLDVDIVNAGLSSETVSGITEPVHPFPRPNVNDRLARVLELVKPNWVVVCYGMNDGIYHPVEPRITDAYRNGLTKLIDEITACSACVILLTPPSFDADATAIQDCLKAAKADEPYGYKKPYANYDKTLVALADIVKSLADHNGVDRVIDLHEQSNRYLQRIKSTKPDYQYGDGIHPPLDGHSEIAGIVLEGIGCDPARVNTTLRQLTGIASPIGDGASVNHEQVEFRDALFARFSVRSAAYRKAIGLASPTKIEASSLAIADQNARAAQQKLRSSIARLLRDDSFLESYRDDATKKWTNEIEALEKLDATESYSEEAILFIGSSSIRLWDTIAKDMEPFVAIRRGYGGAKYSDLAIFAKRLVTPHKYRAMVVFAANDLVGKPEDHSPEEVEWLARYICDVSLTHQPTAPVFLIEVTPTPLRFASWSRICEVNAKLRAIALTKPGVHFIATADHYLNQNKQPRKEYFREDQLHQNALGYGLWSSLIKQSLNDALAR